MHFVEIAARHGGNQFVGKIAAGSTMSAIKYLASANNFDRNNAEIDIILFLIQKKNRIKQRENVGLRLICKNLK